MSIIKTSVFAGFKPLLRSVGALALAMSGSVALASTVSLDFTDSANFTGGTINGYNVDVTAINGTLTSNVGDNGGCVAGDNADIHNLACDGDGLGVNNDEITYGSGSSQQRIVVTIDIDRATRVESIELLDLFQNEGGAGIHEWAQLSINGGAVIDIVSEGNIGGYVLYTLGQDYNTASIVFEFFTNIVAQSDFAVARINLSEVPIPGALLLFGSGIFGLGLFRRKRKS